LFSLVDARRRRLLLQAILILLAFCSQSLSVAKAAVPAPLDLHYHLRLARPSTHMMEVEIEVGQVAEPTLDFVMPAWSPGRYAIYDFAKNVQEFSAVNSQGQPLPWTKLDKQTWRVDARDAGGAVHARYRVYANDLSGSFSQFDVSHANLNGASVFMYIDGHKPDALTLTVESPPNWKLISGFSESLEQRTFAVRDYDVLVDTPMEVSADCWLEQFQERGKTIRVAVHSYAERDRQEQLGQLLEGLKKIVRAQLASMPEPDFSVYTFIIHFAPDIALGDGMEHLNSSQVIVRGRLDGAGLDEALETAAHEFFHLWNVKRLRPTGLGPFDYTRENYSRSLWFAEGVTTYYSYLFLLRAGIWSRADFLSHLADEIRTLEGEPGRRLMSAESSSFHAWFYDRSPQMQETNFANSTISYYNKGSVLGLLLDLEIRGHTRGEKSLDDLLRLLYQQFDQAPAEGYYGPGHGYREEDILAAASQVAGSDLRTWFARFVQGTDELPYAETLARAGLRLRVAVAPGSPPSLGVLTQRLDRGLRITAVRPGQAADRAGLATGDILLAVDNLSLATVELNNRLKIYPPGAEVPFTVERFGREQLVTVTLDPPPLNIYALEDLPGATAEQKDIRKAWLAPTK